MEAVTVTPCEEKDPEVKLKWLVEEVLVQVGGGELRGKWTLPLPQNDQRATAWAAFKTQLQSANIHLKTDGIDVFCDVKSLREVASTILGILRTLEPAAGPTVLKFVMLDHGVVCVLEGPSTCNNK